MATIDYDEIDRRLTYKPPNDEQAARYAQITQAARDFARLVVDLTPGGREQSLAITAIEEARMRANQAIATNE